MDNILNYHPVSPLLATSGQPTVEQFRHIAAAGYKVVINLALVDSSNAIDHEDAVVTRLGLAYLHLPVSWEQPQLPDFLRFSRLLSALADEKVWLHCAKNMRVSCFLYLYQKHILQLPDEQACYPMAMIWQPHGAWAELVSAVDHYYAHRKLHHV